MWDTLELSSMAKKKKMPEEICNETHLYTGIDLQ